MSAPDTNLEKQKARHKPALGGMRLAAGFAALLLLAFVAYLAIQGGQPEGADEQIQPVIGAEEDG